MTISSFKQLFHKELAHLYQKKEAESLFYLFCETILKLERHQLILNLERDLPEQQIERCFNALNRLKSSEPIQYVLGLADFMGFDFQVNPHVLIPRPETEELVALILKDHQNLDWPLKVLDIGTGSGCIAISLAKKQLYFQVTTLDVSKQALEVAKKNASHLDASVSFIHEDLLTLELLPENYDLIVSNPPYVAQYEKKDMHANVLNHEPHSALFVEDHNPLIFYNKILDLASKNACLYLEINPLFAQNMEEILISQKVRQYDFFQDFRGNNRFLKVLI